MRDDRGPRPPVEAEASVPPARFAHFVVKTGDIDRSLAWYQAVLRARVVFRNDLLCFITYDDEHHRVALLRVPEEAVVAGSGAVDHLAYAFDDLPQLLAHYLRLKSLGITPVRTINHGPTISFYYRDPQRVMVEFQIDCFDSDEGRAAFFGSAAFAENPIGVLIDPEALVRQWEEGTPWETIRTRGPLPPGKSPLDMRAEHPS